MNEDTNDKAPKKANKAIEAIKTHAAKRNAFNLPQWALYAILGVCAVVLVWGSVQQFRVWRWGRLMKAAKNQIVTLRERQESTAYRTGKQIADKQIKQIRKDQEKPDKTIATTKREAIRIKQEVKGMTASQLLEEFRKEGF